jgi:hypothetical protein
VAPTAIGDSGVGDAYCLDYFALLDGWLEQCKYEMDFTSLGNERAHALIDNIVAVDKCLKGLPDVGACSSVTIIPSVEETCRALIGNAAGDGSCYTTDCRFGLCVITSHAVYCSAGTPGGLNPSHCDSCQYPGPCLSAGDCQCHDPITTTTTTSTTTTTTILCDCDNCTPGCKGLQICNILNAGVTPVDFTAFYCGELHGNALLCYYNISCPSGWICNDGCLSGAAASPANGNPLYWPGVGSCSAAVSLPYNAQLSDGLASSPLFPYTFVCGGPAGASALSAMTFTGGPLVADPGGLQ